MIAHIGGVPFEELLPLVSGGSALLLTWTRILRIGVHAGRKTGGSLRARPDAHRHRR